ncbi:MAG: hypothetical protein SGPRY_001033 [Prymnesium sp.]
MLVGVSPTSDARLRANARACQKSASLGRTPEALAVVPEVLSYETLEEPVAVQNHKKRVVGGDAGLHWRRQRSCCSSMARGLPAPSVVPAALCRLWQALIRSAVEERVSLHPLNLLKKPVQDKTALPVSKLGASCSKSWVGSSTSQASRDSIASHHEVTMRGVMVARIHRGLAAGQRAICSLENSVGKLVDRVDTMTIAESWFFFASQLSQCCTAAACDAD